MVLGQQAVYTVLIRMEIVKAKMKLYQHKNDNTNGGARTQPDNIDKRVGFLTDDITPGCFKEIG
jgi:hypothetical protein